VSIAHTWGPRRGVAPTASRKHGDGERQSTDDAWRVATGRA
jgi:hypothetical protein